MYECMTGTTVELDEELAEHLRGIALARGYEGADDYVADVLWRHVDAVGAGPGVTRDER